MTTGDSASGGTYGNSSVGSQVDQITVTGGTLNAIGGNAQGDGANTSYGMNSALTLTGGTVNVCADAETSQSTLCSGTATVSGGTLKLPLNSVVSENSTVTAPVTFVNLLTNGCAYQKYGETEPAKLSELDNPLLKSITVVPHEEHDYGKEGKCLYCGLTKPSSSGGSSDPTYSVTAPKADNGTVKVSPRYAEQGDTVTVTVTPDEDYILNTITVLDKNGKKIEVTDKGNEKYSFTIPNGKVTVETTFTEDTADTEEAAPLPAFSDVPTDSYYHDAVLWAAKNSITSGIGNNQFAPDLTCTRAQAAAFLFRYAAANGMESVTLQELVGGYGDAAQVPGYALSAFNWALAQGIVNGYNGTLMPNNDCTRAQIVTMLYRLLGTN